MSKRPLRTLRAAELPALLADHPDASVLAKRLGPTLDATVIDDLVDLRILTANTATTSDGSTPPPTFERARTRS